MSYTTFKEEIVLTARDICQIIKSCKDASITELKFGDLSITFGSATEIAANLNPLAEMTGVTQTQGAFEEKDFEVDEQSTKEESLSLMLIENPFEHERLLASGELENEAI